MAIDVGTWRSGRTGSAPRLETFGAGEGGGADLAQVLVDLGRDPHVATPSQAIEQLGEEKGCHR